MKLEDAKAKLKAAGFDVSAKINDKAGAKENEVLTQSDTTAEKGATIAITYNTSKGSSTTNATTNTIITNTTTTTNTTTNIVS